MWLDVDLQNFQRVRIYLIFFFVSHSIHSVLVYLGFFVVGMAMVIFGILLYLRLCFVSHVDPCFGAFELCFSVSGFICFTDKAMGELYYRVVLFLFIIMGCKGARYF